MRTLGSLLFLKFEANEWERVRDNEIWNFPQKKDDILPSLKVSYDLMPSYLRQCFALLSLYPKDYRMNSFDVASIWGSLGLLSSTEKEGTLTHVANQYLHELLSRSFIQDLVDYGGAFCLCNLHDLVHDLALFVAKDECLVVNSHIQSIPENVRHLSFVENDMHDKLFTAKSLGVRTILFPKEGVGANSEAFLTFISSSKYLQFLDLSHSTFETLPSSIGKLKLLRFLDLSGNMKIKSLPDSICKLQNLQYLLLSGCAALRTLPKGIRSLISLSHFMITTKQAVLPENEIAKLSYLQYLSIGDCDNVESLFSGVEFPILKFLSVERCKRLKSLPLDSKHFPALEVLLIVNCDKLELSVGHVDQYFNLRLKSALFDSLSNLVSLPPWLQGSVNTLVSLFLLNCDNLEVLPDWLPMLTCLKILVIRSCPKLQSLPDDIHCLTALEMLEIDDCPEQSRKYKPQVGEYWNQIAHIKKIFIE